MIRATEDAHLWPELIFLYCHYDEWDNAGKSRVSVRGTSCYSAGMVQANGDLQLWQ